MAGKRIVQRCKPGFCFWERLLLVLWVVYMKGIVKYIKAADMGKKQGAIAK